MWTRFWTLLRIFVKPETLIFTVFVSSVEVWRLSSKMLKPSQIPVFYAALLLKTAQIPLFLDVGLKKTLNYGVFCHLIFKNLAICSGFCLPWHKNVVKNNMFVLFFQVSTCFMFRTWLVGHSGMHILIQPDEVVVVVVVAADDHADAVFVCYVLCVVWCVCCVLSVVCCVLWLWLWLLLFLLLSLLLLLLLLPH